MDTKNRNKTLAAKKKSTSKYDSHKAIVEEDGIIKLRAQNKVLINALKQIQSLSQEQSKEKYDLVWFALNRYRYPNHQASKDIENGESYQEELKKLRSSDGDFYHGFNSGVLASSRLFNHISDVLNIVNVVQEVEDAETHIQKNQKKVQELKTNFPDLTVASIPSHK